MGAFDELKGMMKQAAEQTAVERTTCPRCEWTLTKSDKGVLHCKYCGWTDGAPVKRG